MLVEKDTKTIELVYDVARGERDVRAFRMQRILCNMTDPNTFSQILRCQ
jgi:hypothetical protein